MDYIINPWWFYLVSVLSTLHFIAICGAVLSVLTCLMLVGCYWDHENNYAHDDTYTNKLIGIAKKLGVVLVVCVTLIIIVPSYATMTKMMIANVLTTENIKSGTDFTQDQIGKLVDKITDAAIRVKEADRGR